MKSDEIVSLRSAFRFLRHGDDKAQRLRLGVVLFWLCFSSGITASIAITFFILWLLGDWH